MGRKPRSRRGQKQLDESVCRPEPDQSLTTGEKNPPGDHLVSLVSSSGVPHIVTRCFAQLLIGSRG